MHTRFLIIRNPRAGWHGRHLCEATLEALRNYGASVETVSTTGREEGTLRAREALRSGTFNAVMAAGGDGTIHDVAAGLVGGAMPLGVIPTGTGNVFARELGYPFAAAALAQTLREGSVERIPLGQVNGEPFLFVVGIGFDAEAVRQFEAVDPRYLGRASFVYPVLRALAERPFGPLVVTTESGRHTAHWVIVSRAKHYAAGLLLTPEAGLGKQVMQVIRFEGAGRTIRIRQLVALVTGLLRYDPQVTIEAAGRVTIAGDFMCPVQIDGEAKGALPLEIGLHPERLGVIMPNWIEINENSRSSR